MPFAPPVIAGLDELRRLAETHLLTIEPQFGCDTLLDDDFHGALRCLLPDPPRRRILYGLDGD